MPVPKSIAKVKRTKSGTTITYTNSVDAVQYTVRELTRGALRDVGKFLSKEWQSAYYRVFKKHTGRAQRNVGYWARARECDLQFGLYGNEKKGKKMPGFYAVYSEIGVQGYPKVGLLRQVTYDNIDRIVDIERQYLSGIEADNPDLSGLSEEDYEDES